jgi:SAM-dependent methyltransferase
MKILVDKIRGKNQKKVSDTDYIYRVNNITNELRGAFEEFCYISDSDKLRVADELIMQEGAIDLDVEGLRSKENQRDLSIKFHWGHDHRFNEKKSVKGRMGEHHIRLIAEFIAGFGIGMNHFLGKDVIDVGCWTGGTTLMMKHLGANRVLALEEVQKYAITAKRLLNEVYGLTGVICNGTNLYDLEVCKSYDVAFFPGVVYHLSDPVLGLRRLFNSLRDGGECFVESAGIDSDASIARYDGNRIYHNSPTEHFKDLNRGGWNWFIPSPLCLERWMVEAGFDGVRCYYSQASNRIFGYGKRTKYVDITRAGFSRRDIN